MPLYLTEDDVGRLLTMDACLLAVETAFADLAEGRAVNRPRSRATLPRATLHALPAASDTLARMAAKVYATTRGGARFVVLLFDARTSELLAIVEADRLSQMRTGAASGVATRRLARPEAAILGILGTGWQARSQVAAIARVRPLRSVRAFGRDAGRLAAFCAETARETGLEVIPAEDAAVAVRGADIVVTATSSAQPVLSGAWLSPGAHLNAVGSNRADRREIDSDAVARASLIACDSIEQARGEAGDLILASATGPEGPPAPLDRAVELAAIVSGRHPGRRDPRDITLFKSLGLGIEDLYAASAVYDRAVAAGAGRPVP
ncbi:MAG TPA: ornithine cyclodeaminase family protein [Patescibacteria group bacterium]|nr:ornithine cyclodeaminase family protein [Patescibacteria group bacterium]